MINLFIIFVVIVSTCKIGQSSDVDVFTSIANSLYVRDIQQIDCSSVTCAVSNGDSCDFDIFSYNGEENSTLQFCPISPMFYYRCSSNACTAVAQWDSACVTPGVECGESGFDSTKLMCMQVSGTGGKCRWAASIETGFPCVYSGECTSGRCESGTCVQSTTAGVCTVNRNCPVGHVCISGSCRIAGKEGDICTANSCDPRFYFCEGTCKRLFSKQIGIQCSNPLQCRFGTTCIQGSCQEIESHRSQSCQSDTDCQRGSCKCMPSGLRKACDLENTDVKVIPQSCEPSWQALKTCFEERGCSSTSMLPGTCASQFCEKQLKCFVSCWLPHNFNYLPFSCYRDSFDLTIGQSNCEQPSEEEDDDVFIDEDLIIGLVASFVLFVAFGVCAYLIWRKIRNRLSNRNKVKGGQSPGQTSQTSSTQSYKMNSISSPPSIGNTRPPSITDMRSPVPRNVTPPYAYPSQPHYQQPYSPPPPPQNIPYYAHPPYSHPPQSGTPSPYYSPPQVLSPSLPPNQPPQNYEQQQAPKQSTDKDQLSGTYEIKDIEILEKLGGGQFGEVYKGVVQGVTVVALKKLKDVEQLKEFIKEASTLQSLSFPNIVQFYGIYKSPTKDQYLVTEYLSRGSLRDLLLTIDRDQISMIDLLGMARDAAAGIMYLHQRGIVHCDIAARNILVANAVQEVTGFKFIAKIGDFGMSKSIMNLDKNYYQGNNKVLPVKWSAPETLQFGKFSIYSDYWSYGVVLYEIFTYGSNPYPAMSNTEVLEQVLGGYRMKKPLDCPDNMYRIMQGLWESEPEKRIGMQEVIKVINSELELLRPTKQSSSEIASPETSNENSSNLYQHTADFSALKQSNNYVQTSFTVQTNNVN